MLVAVVEMNSLSNSFYFKKKWAAFLWEAERLVALILCGPCLSSPPLSLHPCLGIRLLPLSLESLSLLSWKGGLYCAVCSLLFALL